MIVSMRCSRPSRTSHGLHCTGVFRAPRDQPLPEVEGDKPVRKRFKTYPIGYFHIDIAEVRTAEGKRYLFVAIAAIDRTSKFAVAQLVEKANRKTAWRSWSRHRCNEATNRHTILTDNGIQFADQPRNRNTAYAKANALRSDLQSQWD